LNALLSIAGRLMGATFAEIVLILAALAGIYELMRPLQRRLEVWMLDRLAPNRRRVIDVKSEEE